MTLAKYITIPVYLFAATAVAAVFLGWAYTAVISSDTKDALGEHRERLELQDGESRIPDVSEIDLVEDDWVRVAQVRQRVSLVNLAYVIVANLGIVVVLLWSGYSALLDDLFRTVTRFRLVHWALYLVVMVALLQILTLPVAFLQSYYLPHLFEVSTTTVGLWSKDFVVTLGFHLLFNVPAILVFYGLLNRFRRTWPIWLTALALPYFLLIGYVWPLAVAPLFNTYEPIDDAEVRERATELTAKAGVSAADIYSVDLSRRTLEGNAFVSGLGASKRIAIGDNLLDHYTPAEVGFVIGHELGHYAEKHILYLIAADVLRSLVVFLVLWPLLGWYVRRFGALHGVTSIRRAAIYPLVAAALLLLPFVTAPAYNAVSRYVEHRADVYALNLTDDAEVGVASFKKLAYQGLAVPEPPAAVKFWLYSHPPISERISFLEANKEDR